MELRQLVEAYVDELETNSPAPSFSHLTLATLYDQFGQSKTDGAIAAECKNREQQRAEQRRCSIPKTRSEVIRQCIADIAPDGIIRIDNNPSDGRRCSIPETDNPSDECNRLGEMFAH